MPTVQGKAKSEVVPCRYCGAAPLIDYTAFGVEIGCKCGKGLWIYGHKDNEEKFRVEWNKYNQEKR